MIYIFHVYIYTWNMRHSVIIGHVLTSTYIPNMDKDMISSTQCEFWSTTQLPPLRTHVYVCMPPCRSCSNFHIPNLDKDIINS